MSTFFHAWRKGVIFPGISLFVLTGAVPFRADLFCLFSFVLPCLSSADLLSLRIFVADGSYRVFFLVDFFFLFFLSDPSLGAVDLARPLCLEFFGPPTV